MAADEIRWSADIDIMSWVEPVEPPPDVVMVQGRFYQWVPDPKRWWQFGKGNGKWVEIPKQS